MTRLGIVVPAGPITSEYLAAGLELARRLGLEVECAESLARDVAGERFWLNGDDETRGAALVAALRQQGEHEVDGVWMARGGYGSARALGVAMGALVQAQAARERPASMWGFSDGTVLVGHWADRGWESWHAPALIQLPRLDEDSLERLKEAVSGLRVRPFEGLSAVRSGTVEGRLVGGNLAVLCSLVGTPLMPRLGGDTPSILVVEDVNEAAYRVDRMFQQLVGAGVLDGVVGLVVGDFTGVSERELEGIGVVVRELAELRGWVCASGLPVGHGARNACLPMGRLARLEVGVSGRLSVDLGVGEAT